MITDIIQGLNSNHKVQSSMLKVQRINSSMLKIQRIKTIRGISEIRSQCLNLFYIVVKEMVGEMVKTSDFSTFVSLLLSSSCKGGSQKVLNRTSIGR